MNKKTKSALLDTHVGQVQQIERYRLLVESVQDYAIFLLDPIGRVASWNAGAKRFKGYNENEIIGQHFSIFYPEKDILAGKPERELIEARQFGRIEDEGWRIRKDGSRFWANVVITALYDKEGALQGFAKVTRDLTERKKMEDDLRSANIELQHQRDELSLLNQAKDEFISLASHQLRTPATAVKQYIGLVLQGFLGKVPQKQLSALKKANLSNDRQIGLINDLLRVAQIDAGKLVIKRTSTNIIELIKDVVAEQEDSFNDRGQVVKVNSSAKQIIVNIDSGRLRMVLENLIDNASKYTPQNGKITVSIKKTQGWLYISIADNGVGIAAEDIPKLFTKFSRINNELSDEVGGSGLGLYWANKVVQMHGGHIEVESINRQGTKFTILIPVEKINA